MGMPGFRITRETGVPIFLVSGQLHEMPVAASASNSNSAPRSAKAGNGNSTAGHWPTPIQPCAGYRSRGGIACGWSTRRVAWSIKRGLR